MRRDAATAPLPAAGRVAESAYRVVDDVYRSESRRILATLIRLLGDFELAEEAVHDAFASGAFSSDGWAPCRAD